MYAIGQKFDAAYPPEAAIWCNEYGAMIVQVEGNFEIQAVPALSTEQSFALLRSERDTRLASTDKMLLPDYPICADDLTLVKAYRTALRDLPDQSGAPWDGGGDETPWPTAPNAASTEASTATSTSQADQSCA